MSKEQEQAGSFLQKYNAGEDSINTQELFESFMEQMDKGLHAEKSSLQMEPAFIDVFGEVQSDKCICVDVGGTNLRIALVSLDEGLNENIEYFEQYSIPGKDREIDCDEFFDEIAKYLLPIIDKSENIAVSFAFVTKSLPDRDAEIVEFAKEVKVRNARGKLIAKELRKALKRKGIASRKNITVINDTVAVLLSGRSSSKDNSYAGFILGTGTNTSVLAIEKNVEKLHSDSQNSIILNVESGRFDKVRRSIFEKELDGASEIPGDHIFEKMVAGEYIGSLVSSIINGAYKDGLISKSSPVLTTTEVSNFIREYQRNQRFLTFNKEESEFIYYIIQGVKKRIVKLVGVNILSAAVMSARQSFKNRVVIVAEGSTFSKFYKLKEDVESFLIRELTQKRGTAFEIVCPKQAVLRGCAVAGLLK